MEFRRPPISEWMSPPKSSGIPDWTSPRCSLRKRNNSTSREGEPYSKNQKSEVTIEKTDPVPEASQSSTSWVTPSKRGRKTRSDPISLQLSPRISVTLTSPERVEAFLSSNRDRTRQKFSLEIRSPSRRKRRHKNRTSDNDSDLSESVETSLQHSSEIKDKATVEEVHKSAVASPSNVSPCRGSPVATPGRAKSVIKSVLHDFIPPRRPKAATIATHESKAKSISPRKSTPVVKKIDIPDFKIPYSFSPPQKLSAKKSRKSIIDKDNSNTENHVCGSPKKVSTIFAKTLNEVNLNSPSEKQNMGAQSKVTDIILSLNTKNDFKENIDSDGRMCSTSRTGDTNYSPRKRNIDVQAARNFIREQKLKRRKIRQEEKARTVINIEEKNKKLEELRLRTLLLAAASRKKNKKSPTKADNMAIKIVDNEDELSTSLGLRQSRPKRSFRESLASLQRRQGIPNNDLDCDDDLKTDRNCEDEEINVKGDKSKSLDAPLQINQNMIQEPLSPPNVPSLISRQDNLNIKETLDKIDSAFQEMLRKRAIKLAAQNVNPKPSTSFQNHSKKLNVVPVDMKVLTELKSEMNEMAQNFKLLQNTVFQKQTVEADNVPASIPDWLKSIHPRPHPYNVLTAVKNKLKVNNPVESTHPDYNSPYASDFEPLSSAPEPLTPQGTIEHHLSSPIKRDSGSDLSSSILDSEKIVSTENSKRAKNMATPGKDYSSIQIEESVADVSSNVPSGSAFSSYKENIILMPPDIKVISNNLSGEKLNNSIQPFLKAKDTIQEKSVNVESLNRSDSTITEIIDNISEIGEKPNIQLKRTNEILTIDNSNHKSFEARIQAELSFLDSLKQTLSVMEADRLKTLTEMGATKLEKAINTEEKIKVDDQGVQTSIIESYPVSDIASINRTPDIGESLNESVEKNIDDDSIITEIEESAKSSESVPENIVTRITAKSDKSLKADSSESTAGISLQMLNRMIKDEELRSEHQLALIQLRQNSLIDKTKAELAVLETKKKTLKQRGGDADQLISAIKKKQRGILLRYQSERQEIERLKRMHHIASEERKIMFKQQKQIHKMQLTTKDMLVKLKKKQYNPKRTGPLKSKGLFLSDMTEDGQGQHSETNDTAESSLNHSNVSDFDISSQQALSEGEDEIFRRNQKTLQERILRDAEKLNKCKTFLGEREKKLLQQKHFVEEILEWKNRLEAEEKHLSEMRKRAMNIGGNVTYKSLKSTKSVQDRSTSPFQYNDHVKDDYRTKEQDVKSDDSSKSEIPEVLSGSIIDEEVPEDISKITSTPRTDYSESFDASSETIKSLAATQKSDDAVHLRPPIMIKSALSPRSTTRPRNSSGSDDSANLSHPETASEQSDVEGRIQILHEELRRRKLEADRLRREQKRKSRERLKAKEESLIKQIQAYDTYIDKVKNELKQEQDLSVANVVRPVIKQPKAEKRPGKKEVIKNIEEKESEQSIREEIEGSRNDSMEEKIISEIAEDETVEADSNINLDASDVESKSVRTEISENVDEGGAPDGSDYKESDVSSREEVDSASLHHSVSENLEKSDVSVSSSVSEAIEEEQENKTFSADLEEEVEKPSDDSDDVDSSSVKTTIPPTIGTDDKIPIEKSDMTSNIVSTAHSVSIQNEGVSGSLLGEGSIEDENLEPTSAKLSEEKDDSLEVKEAESGDVEEQIDIDVDTKYVSDDFESDSDGDEVSQSIYEDPLQKNVDLVQVERITDSLLSQLLADSVTTLKNIKEKSKKVKLEIIIETMAESVIEEAVNDVLSICRNKCLEYERSASLEMNKRDTEDCKNLVNTVCIQDKENESTADEEPISPARITSEVRRRIHEIMATQMALSPVASPDRVQSFMQTTYDVSPTNSSPKFDQRDDGLPTQEEFISSLSPRHAPLTKVQVAVRDIVHANPPAEGDGQEWFDEDFGLSKTRKEAEQLRLQQLQIEQEIEQLQAQQQQVPYFYLREIPNKPPPPYTPPGKASSAEKAPSCPASADEVTRQMKDFSRTIYMLMQSGIEVNKIEPNGGRIKDSFSCFLWDLAKELVVDISRTKYEEKEEEILPWDRVPPPISACRYALRPRTADDVVNAVVNRTMILMGFKARVAQESQIVRWSRKKRDHVDELLIWETQAEETDWTCYDVEIVAVKNEITEGLMDSLLQETADIMDSIIKKKNLSLS